MTCQCCRDADRLTAQVRGVEVCDECASFMRLHYPQAAQAKLTAAHALIAQWREMLMAYRLEHRACRVGYTAASPTVPEFDNRCWRCKKVDELEARLTPQEASELCGAGKHIKDKGYPCPECAREL